jgi:hypothetical protein
MLTQVAADAAPPAPRRLEAATAAQTLAPVVAEMLQPRVVTVVLVFTLSPPKARQSLSVLAGRMGDEELSCVGSTIFLGLQVRKGR